MNHKPQLWSMRFLRKGAKVAAVFVAGVGCLVLMGWILDISLLKSVVPNLVTMKANTALGFVLAGTSLFISSLEPTAFKQRRIGQFCSLVVIALGLATLSQYLWGWNLGIDQLLFVDDPQAIGTLTPGRMSPLTAVCFALVGSALWLSGVTRRSRSSPATPWIEILAILTSLIAAQVVIAYLYQVQPIIGFAVYTQMAVHTAVCFVVLAIGILMADPYSRVMGTLAADGTGGIIARRLLPAAISIPLILGWLRIVLARIGVFEPAFGTSILVVLHIIAFTGLVLWNSQQLHHIDLQRQASARALSQANDELENRIQQRTAELQAANERLSLAIEGAGMATWDMDIQTGLGVWSAQHFKLMGYHPVLSGEATVEMWRSRIYPEDLEQVAQIEAQAIRERELLSYEYRIIHPDNGQLRWLKSIGRFLYNQAGQAVRCRGIVFDVTESKRAQEERDRFFTLSNEMIAIVDSSGHFRQVNPAWERVLGYTQAELIEQPFLSFVHPDDHEATRLATERFENGNPAASFENRYRCKDGSYKWLSWTAFISPDHNLSYASARDITEHKQAEQQLAEQARVVQQQANLLELTSEAIFVRDQQGAITYWNRGAEAMYGWRRAEVSGLVTHTLLQTQTPEHINLDQVLLQQESWQGELTHTCKNGQQIIVDSRQVLIRDEQGSPTGFLEVNRDITDRKLTQLNDQFLTDLDLRLRQLSDADEMLWEAVSSIGKYLNVERCVWHEVDTQADVSIVKQDWRLREDISSVVGVSRLSEAMLPEMIDCFHAGQPAVVPDVATHLYTAPFVANFAELDIRAFVAVPCIYEGLWVAVLAINARTVQEWQPHQVALLQNAVARLWSMIQQARATQALRESEERFRSALLNVPLPIMLHTEDGEVLQVNHVWTEITGYHLEDIPTLAAWTARAYSDRSVEVQAQIFSEYPLTERTAMGEYAVTTCTGETRIWDFYAAPLQALPNGRRLVIATAIDITEHKQAQADLQKYKDIFQFAEHGLAIARGSVIERINPAFARIHGYTVEELAGKPILNLFPPEAHAEALNFIQRLNEVEHLTYETVHLRKDGTTLPVLLDVTVVQDEPNLPYRIVNLFDITKRKQAEQEIINLNHELQRQLAESQTLLDVLPIGVGIALDPECKQIRVNSAMAQMLAIAPSDNASLSAPPEERPTSFKVYQNQQELLPEDLPLQRAAAHGIEVRDFEVDVVWHDGTTLTLLEYAAPLFDQDGHTRGSIGAFLNITERKQAEVALQRSLKDLADFKLALDQSSIVAITDAQGTITYVNDKFCELSQYTPAELIGQNHRLINSGYHPKEFFQQMWATISKGQVWQGEIRNRAKDGTYYWVATTIVPFLNSAGKPYQYIAVRSDITARKAAEAQLQQSNLNLQRSLKDLADFKLALDQSSIVAITDAQGTITYVNDKFCQLSQYSPAELIGQNHRLINSGYHPKEFFQQMWGTISKGHVWQGEIRNRAKDGTYYWVATTIVPFLNSAGKPYQYIAVRSDITARKAAEAQLQQSNITLEQRVEERTAQLQEANKQLEAFSYTVAHDLRAPLRGIQGFAQALVEDYGEVLDEMATEYIQYIFDGTERMNNLVTDLLAYSRLSREQIRLIPLQLAQVVAEAIAQLETELRDRQALISVAQDLPKVWGQRSILVQMVVNLLSNGMKFVASGVQPQIRVWTEVLGGEETRGKGTREMGNLTVNSQQSPVTHPMWVRLWVEDNGIGIDPAYQEQIFGVFERLHGIEAYPGTGIGLAIVRKGAERLGGRAGVDSAPNRGSRFWIELPEAR